MKITGDTPVPELDPKQTQSDKAGGAKAIPSTKHVEGPNRPGTPNGDPVELSERARQLLQLMGEMSKVPEGESERVAEIRRAVENGTYKVSGEAVAESMLEALSKDKRL